MIPSIRTGYGKGSPGVRVVVLLLRRVTKGLHTLDMEIVLNEVNFIYER